MNTENAKNPEILFRFSKYGKWINVKETQKPEDLPDLFSHFKSGGRLVIEKYFLEKFIHKLFIQIRVDGVESTIKIK